MALGTRLHSRHASRVMVEGARRVRQGMAKDEKEAAEKREKAERDKNWAAIRSFDKWVSEGKQLDKDGRPRMAAADAKAMVKVLLPRLAPEEKLSDCGTTKKCIDWLVAIGGGTSWTAEMEKLSGEATGVSGDAATCSQPENPPTSMHSAWDTLRLPNHPCRWAKRAKT